MTFKKKGRIPADSTVSIRLHDPQFSSLGDFPSEKLEPLRERLSKCTVIHNESGVRFSNFVQNMEGLRRIPLNAGTLMAIKTGKNLFVLTNKAPESFYDNNPGLMNVDFKRRCMIARPDGGTMYICTITSGEYNMILAMAAQGQPPSQDAARQPAAAGERLLLKPETMMPGPEEVVTLEEFRRKLSSCEVVLSPDPSFDLAKFAKSVVFAAPFQDVEDNSYYYIEAGSEGLPYTMHINRGDITSLDAVILTFNDDTCVLVPED